MHLLSRLVVLAAVLLMPFGMAPAPASALHHRVMTASMPMQHCPNQGSNDGVKGGFADCTMACAATLPAGCAAAGARLLIARSPTATGPEQRLDGLHPDTATPPPKRA